MVPSDLVALSALVGEVSYINCIIFGEISDYHDDENEDGCLLERYAV
jgi:hypothetical protein